MVDNVSIGQLYGGAFLPGFLLAGLYIAYISIRCYINPRMGPPIPKEERLSFSGKMKVSMPIIPVAILIFLVLGTILIGIAAPTEAAGVGCAGAFVILAFQRRLKWKGVVEACENTLKSSAMVLWTMFGANVFVALYVMVGGGKFVTDLLLGIGDRWVIIVDHAVHPDLSRLFYRLGGYYHAHRPDFWSYCPPIGVRPGLVRSAVRR
jgi:TRAP-type mannitol/chloroaromatic compound transport system permease large subunit